MTARGRAGLSRLLGARARLRWVHLILGGALLMPYFLLTQVVVGGLGSGSDARTSLLLNFAAYALALPIVAVSGLFGLVRPMSVAAVRAMCAVPGELLAEGRARSWAARGRASAWWTLHLGVGALVSGMSLAVPPMAVVLLALPFVSALRELPVGLGPFDAQAEPYAAPLLGIGLLAGLVLCAAGAGALLARLAPVLLGPTAADRLAAAEERAADLAVRNRLARELHDAVGHALSAVTLQASAARRVLDSDPGFVREALAAIEDTTRRTVGELDAVLGLLREGDGAGAGGTGLPAAPTLAADLDGLLARSRASGTPITARQDPGPAGDWAWLPAIASREAYRIVQEGLSNALRHGTGPVDLRILVRARGGHGEPGGRGESGGKGESGGQGKSGGCEEHGGHQKHGGYQELEITMTNDAAAAPGARTTGGRGLHGAAERASLLGGQVEAGWHEGRWRLRAVLPLGEGAR
ncbi:sensor histidine kinase [Streptomyces sp. AP-93]|uniref:sensor histidine kinase n=1 Tax=Streptomyces sp. AP-93 TaxID=2929048 RepID=UPI001FAFEDA3|nr:histidine kinase [Streptomyces sp. AP-93]MCJ0872834.1 histidine kinase [Streptomyces sp. AP-93]